MKSSEGRPKGPGCVYDGRGASFSVFSSVATKVEICFLEASGLERRHELSKGANHFWHGYFEGIEPGCLYGYRVHGPWDPSAGHLCHPDLLLLDPYAKAVYGDVRWHDSLFPYDPENPARPVNLVDTASYMPRSVVVDSSFDWGDDRRPGTKLEDTIIYEIHVKGFTVGRREIPPELRGTYAGLAHPAAIEHLTGLGVTAVELLPVQQFVHRRRLVEQGLRNFWGYDPICFFAPHNSYALDQSPGGAVNEFKSMVKSLHAAGLEVILDVVFNHTGEGGSHGAVLCHKGIDNRAYYRLLPGDEPAYADFTGTKNTLNAEHPQVRRMIIDALVYWTEEMHVDGFRFDLAPTLAREKDRVRMDGAFLNSIREEPSLRRVKLIAEPWDLGEGGYQAGRFPVEWSEWNGCYQDDVRDYWNGREGVAGRFMLRITGSPDIYLGAGKSPQASVNYVTSHDGFTLNDLVSYEVKHNEANREGGRDGRDDNHAWNCGAEGPTDDRAINEVRARQRRNFIATLLLSQGVPMLLGGDELGRTQHGNNNPYCQDNQTSWLDWSSPDVRMHDFVKKLIYLRSACREFRRSDWSSSEQDASRSWSMTWYDPVGNEIRSDETPNSPREPLQGLLSDGNDFLLMFNPRTEEITFKLPAKCKIGAWRVVVDTSLDSGPRDESAAAVGKLLKLNPHSLVVLSRRE